MSPPNRRAAVPEPATRTARAPGLDAAATTTPPPGRSPLGRRVGRLFVRLFERPRGRLATAGVAALVLAAVLAPWLTPYDPAAQLGIETLAGRAPSLAHPFGTDPYSRDVFSRVLYGARVSLSVAVVSTLLSVTVATLYGAVSGFRGGRVDALMMRVVDGAMAVPRVLLLLAIGALWGGLTRLQLVLLLGLTQWFGVSRLVRAEVLVARGEEYVTSARALGASEWRVLFRHVLPNVLSPVLVAATIGVSNVIALEAGLSYLGFGIRPPAPSWGNIIQDGSDQVANLWWVSLFPGLAIVLTVACFTALGDALRDVTETRQGVGERG
jgi:peptide/nickel transport system permease protein